MEELITRGVSKIQIYKNNKLKYEENFLNHYSCCDGLCGNGCRTAHTGTKKSKD